jgi:hypothetical protein
MLLAMALAACGGVVQPAPEKDAGIEEAATDAGSTPSFDVFVPPMRDANEEVILPVYGGAPPPPDD